MTEFYDEEGNWVSKSQRKRDCHDIQKLGENLMKLKLDDLQKIDLPDTLISALHEAKSITQHTALKRHKQYIGKLLIRDNIAEDIDKQLQKLLHKDDTSSLHFKHLEQWRDNIMQGGDTAINDFVSEFPQADRQHLRQINRKAIKEQEQGKSTSAYKSLFQYIREIYEAQTPLD